MTGEELRAARERLALTQKQLAESLDVEGGGRTIRRWENGERGIPSYLRLAVEHLSCARPKRSRRRPTR